MNKLGVLGIVSLLTVAVHISPVTADEKPPANAKPLSEIARTIEQRADFQAGGVLKQLARLDSLVL